MAGQDHPRIARLGRFGGARPPVVVVVLVIVATLTATGLVVHVAGTMGEQVVQDRFDRSVADSWSRADAGETYYLEGPVADFRVDDSTGVMTIPRPGLNRTAMLADMSGTDVDIAFRFAVDKMATGNGVFIYAILRRVGASAYRPKAILASNGSVRLHAGVLNDGQESPLGPAIRVPRMRHSPGSFMWLRSQVYGTDPTTIRLRVWDEGGPEPETWAYSVTDSTPGLQGPGSVGLQSHLSATSIEGSVAVSFDDLIVRSTGSPGVIGITVLRPGDTSSRSGSHGPLADSLSAVRRTRRKASLRRHAGPRQTGARLLSGITIEEQSA